MGFFIQTKVAVARTESGPDMITPSWFGRSWLFSADLLMKKNLP